MLGISQPTNYYSFPFSTFPMHVESGNLAAANLLVSGHPKVWYVVPPAQAYALQLLMKEIFAPDDPTLLWSCKAHYLHKM